MGAAGDPLVMFCIGSSWGGFESLVVFNYIDGLRSASPWSESGFLLRMRVGLEDLQDLIQDLEAAFESVA